MHAPPRSFFFSSLTTIVLLLAEATALAQSPPPPTYAPPPAYAPPPGYVAPGYYPPPAYYPPPGYGGRPVYKLYAAPPPGYHQHDGFYLRLYTGLGFLSASDTSLGSKETYSGAGVTFGASFGGVIAPNLVLFGEFLGTVVSDPTYDFAGQSQTLSGLDATLVGFGPGVAYYLQPVNLYFSGTLTFSQLSLSDSQSNDSSNSADLTNLGIGTNLMAGKEWWVSSEWGLGMAAQLHIASMKMKSSDARMTATVLSLLFSATYN